MRLSRKFMCMCVFEEYLNYEEGKFSKSRNVGVFGNNARDSGIPADVFRFYLLFVRPESQDSTFSWVDFAIKSNTELLNNLGNFINRALSFCFNSFKAEVQEISSLEKEDEDVIDNVNKELQSYIECMEKVRIRDALSKILNVSRWGNGYIQSTQPWVLNKSSEPENKARAGAINAICVNIVHICAQMLEPFMPQTAFEIFNQMGLYASSDDQNGLPLLPKSFIRAIPTGHKINKPVPLFKKLEESEVMKLKEMYGGAQQGKSPGGNTGGGAALVGVNGKSVQELQSAITEQGDIVRKLKAAKPPDKKKISEEVEILKKLKSDFEKASNEVKEASKENNAQAANQNKAEDCMLKCPYAGMSEETLKNMCTEQGNKVRALKAAKPQNKAEISAQVEILKQLKPSWSLL
ncbi:methionine--tRNA ligase, cytoplasmic-like [Symsagittifera roscoffensis]|uniref:methionine--tRNA ligase, cytoplasmic-like n=1 Tax=Symsagittifera roscoffensis TaxID=84072 RepID=UPI00307B1EA8